MTTPPCALAAALALPLALTPAHAMQGSDCDQGPITACGSAGAVALPFQYAETEATNTPFQDSLVLDRYTGAEPLVGARFTIQMRTYGDLQYWNQSGATCPLVSWEYDTLFGLSSPTHPDLCAQALPVSWTLQRSGSFTDVPDGGLAGELFPLDGLCLGCPSGSAVQIGTITDPALLASLSGPGDIRFDVSFQSVVTVSGCQPGQTLYNETVFASVTLEYFVCPEPGSPACFGDSLNNDCPCLNQGAAGEGCANSTGSGSVLSGAGVASLSDDTLVLQALSTPSQPGLFFQGDTLLQFPPFFGDGLRCCGGNIIRVVFVGADGNCASTDQPSGCGTQIGGMGGPISQLPGNSGLQPGDSRCYQWWYRDIGPANPCQGQMFNLSNAYVVTWGP